MALDRQHAALLALLAAAAGVSLWLLRRQLSKRSGQYEDLDGECCDGCPCSWCLRVAPDTRLSDCPHMLDCLRWGSYSGATTVEIPHYLSVHATDTDKSFQCCTAGIVSFSSRFVAGAATCYYVRMRCNMMAGREEAVHAVSRWCFKAFEMLFGTILQHKACLPSTKLSALMHVSKVITSLFQSFNSFPAMRAMESEEDGRIYSDPLAGVLAGSTAIPQVRGMLEVSVHLDTLRGHSPKSELSSRTHGCGGGPQCDEQKSCNSACHSCHGGCQHNAAACLGRLQWLAACVHADVRQMDSQCGLQRQAGLQLQGTTSKEGNGAPKRTPEAAEALQKLRRKHPVRDIALRTWW